MRVIGGAATGGCIAGAERLPDSGVGYETIHQVHSRFWGAPETIARIEQLGREANAAGLPDLYVEDISAVRGGPLPGGHLSHQTGLDVDIGLDMQPRPRLAAAERETVELPSLVAQDGRGVDLSRWTPDVVRLLKLAAMLPDVDRVLVNPAIKRQLCHEVRGDRAWLRLIRPWYGHAAHMHIRFRCPPGQKECVQALPPPEGDGCDATLQWWFEPHKPTPPHRPPPLPAACRGILGAAFR